MTCPSALNCSRYADGDLPAAEAAALQQHLTGCAACRNLVAGFESDIRALKVAMQAVELTGPVPTFVPRPTMPRLLAWCVWLALTVWAVNAAWMSLATSAALPGWLAWLGPEAAGLGVSALVGLVLDLSSGNADLFAGLFQTIRSLALLSGAGAAVWLLLRSPANRSGPLCLGLIAAASLSLAAPQSHAFELKRDDHRVVVAADEVVDDTVLIVSEEVVIDGTVTGDLLAMGERVSIRGSVQGTAVILAETLTLEGRMAGSVISLGETVEMRGADLGANLFAGGEEVRLDADTRVAANLAVGAEEADVHASIGRDLWAGAGRLTLSGSTQGDLRVYGQSAELTGTARIGGDLYVMLPAEDRLTVADGAVIDGAKSVNVWPEERNPYLSFNFYLGIVLRVIAALLAGLLLFHLFPGLRDLRLHDVAEGLTTAGIGAVALVATPILAVIAVMTLIGAPIGVTLLLLWLVALYAAGILSANLIGNLILDEETRGSTLTLTAGLIILVVLVSLPILGGIVRLIALIVGLGLIVQWLRSSFARTG